MGLYAIINFTKNFALFAFYISSLQSQLVCTMLGLDYRIATQYNGGELRNCIVIQ